MVNVAVIGCGYWGPNLVRNFNDVDSFAMSVVADLRPERLKFIKNKYPQLEVTTDADELFRRTDIDAVVITTPVSTHYHLAKEALINDKHVLVEKPMTQTVQEAEDLIDLAEKKQRVLMVDHTFIYTGAVRKIKEIIDSGELGEIYYFDSVRVNLGLFQHDVNVIWDLAPHDVSIMDYLIKKKTISVSATGASHFEYGNQKLENIAYVTVKFENETIAHFHLNWLTPVKIRRTLIGGSRKMIVYDDLEASEKVKVYDSGVEIKSKEEVYETLIQYRTGDMYAPKLDQSEALRVECEHFLDCIVSGQKPITDGYAGLRVVKILELANNSLRSGGKEFLVR